MIFQIGTIDSSLLAPAGWVCTYVLNGDTCRERAVMKVGFANEDYGRNAACNNHIPGYFSYIPEIASTGTGTPGDDPTV